MPGTQASLFANRKLAPDVQTGELLSDAPWLIFRSAGEPGILRIWDGDSGEAETIANRHREAMFLHHPGILRTFRTGVFEEGGTRWCYALYEPYDALLMDLLSEGPATPEEAHDLALGLTGPLDYLHSQGLVYCHLDPRTVARKNGQWMLCDYSQLRLAGTGYAAETRRLLARIPSAPPEAFEGNVSPAWDAWGLAHLTRTALLGLRTRRYSNERPVRAEQLPEPFASVVASCSASDPHGRCTIADIARSLREHRPQPTVAPPPLRSVRRPEQPTVADLPTQRTAPPPALPEVEPVPVEPRAPIVDRRNPALMWALLGLAAAVVLLVLTLGRDNKRPSTTASAEPEKATSRANAAPVEPDLPDATEPDASTRGRTTEHAQLSSLVQSWATDFRQGDMSGHLSHYAPRVERLFLKRNVDLNFVRQVKEQSLAPGNEIRRYDISNIRTQLRGKDRAVVTFDKTYDIAGASPHSGKVRSELKLRRYPDGWRIVSERDAKVYWQKRS